MKSFSWTLHVFSLELRKIFTYRVNFWLSFLLQIVTELAVAYFLWKAVFEANHVDSMNGFSFYGILYYYLFGSFCSRIIQDPNNGDISGEIYQGGLTRYLLYPLSFFLYKFVTAFSAQVVALVQMVACLFIAIWFWKLPSDQSISVSSVLLGSATCLFAGYVYFALSSCLEMVAFWQDAVWNLLVIFRFSGNLLGGLMIPLSFFPHWGKVIVDFTPFPYLYAFPIRCFLGQVGTEEWVHSIIILSGWAAISTVLSRLVWGRGLKFYSGVGI
jgi:ABC-2 type transport system permease protein